MRNLNYPSMRSIFKDKQAPYAYIFQEALEKNIQTVLKRAKSKKIRIASKSIRNISALKFIAQKLGANYRGLMTYHLDESIYLLENGFDHCLMGYPQTCTEERGSKIKSLAQNGKKLVQMVDSLAHLSGLEALGEKIDHTFEVCIDIDLSLQLPGVNFGVFRSPLKNVEACYELLKGIKEAKYVRCVGIMGYEAQVAGVGDFSGKGFLFDGILSFLKKWSTKNIYAYRGDVTRAAKEYFELDFINGGGSGSISMTAGDDSVDEITVGSGFFCPHLFDRYHESFSPACGYAVEVVRKPSENMLTCHGGGYVASGSVGVDKLPQVFLPKNLTPEKNEMFGEVQTPLYIKGNTDIGLGDPVFLRHAKSGEVMERFSTALVVQNNKISTQWNSYRGDGLCFL